MADEGDSEPRKVMGGGGGARGPSRPARGRSPPLVGALPLPPPPHPRLRGAAEGTVPVGSRPGWAAGKPPERRPRVVRGGWRGPGRAGPVARRGAGG